MKLIFIKNQEGEMTVKMAAGTVAEEFSYTKMIKQLLKKNNFDDTEYKGVSEDEKKRIEDMLRKITASIEEEKE